MEESATDTKKKPLSYLFLIGAPRSGTTWLQLLLAQNTSVATTSETHLFTQYLNLLEQRWKHEKSRQEGGYKTSGLTQVVSEDDFYSLLRIFADGVLLHGCAKNKDTAIYIEKTPEHTLHGDLISRVYPEANYLHIVRDPRAVANSFSNAAKTWWSWTPSGPISVTRRWRENVEKGRKFSKFTGRYLEVRYEDLLNDGPRQLLQIWKWLGIQSDLEECERAIQVCQIDNLRSGSDSLVKPWSIENEPDGFFRKGCAEDWHDEMSNTDISAVEHYAHDLMAHYNYQPIVNNRNWLMPYLVWYRITENIYKGVTFIGRRLERKMYRNLMKL